MSLLKYMKDKSTWITFYVDAINNRLRRDKNLGDLLDKQAARDNLELSGDNNVTHFHDSRYMTKIDQEITDRKKADADLTAALNREKTERQSADTEMANSVAGKLSVLEGKANAVQSLVNDVNANLATQIVSIKDSVDSVGNKSTTVSGSTQAALTTNTVLSTSVGRKGGSYCDTIRIDYTTPGVAAGTYSLDTLLSELVQKSHNHTQGTTSRTYNCVPNCNCQCSSSH